MTSNTNQNDSDPPLEEMKQIGGWDLQLHCIEC